MALSIQKVLEEYGLKERHARIYLACLSLGSASVQGISKRAGFARSTCEAVLESLQQKGFVTSLHKKNIRYFSPEDPRKLVRLLRRKQDLIEQALPQFLGAYNAGTVVPYVRFYTGKEGMNSILEEILEEAESLISYGSIDDLYNVLSTTFPDFTRRRLEKKIPVRVILKDTPLARLRQKMGPKELRDVRLIQDDLPYAGIIFLWADKITMFSFKDDIVALVIESRELHNIHKTMFDQLWNILPVHRA